jgi:hypothetical protein
LTICTGNTALKCLATGIKVTKIITRTIILRFLMMTGQPLQAKLAHPLVMVAGSGVKPAQKEKVTLCKQTAMYRQGAHMINAR